MMTNGMKCELFTEQLMAFMEHELDDATRYAMERHAVTCDDCGPLLADLRKLRMDAANLPQLQLPPGRDLWSGIAARIEAPVVDIGTARAVPSRRSMRLRRWMNGAMIAASLVVAAGIGYLAADRNRPDLPVTRVSEVPPAESLPGVEVLPEIPTPDRSTGVNRPPTETPPSRTPQPPAARLPEVQNVLATLTSDYDREIARLRKLIDERRNQLDPVTVGVIEKNLQVIDAAIEDSKKAIARDPASRFLIESLNESLRTKVELMRTAALLPSRT